MIEDAWRASKDGGNNFDAIRLAAAALVIFSHAFEIADGSRAREPLERLSGQISLGELAVLIFFSVSGFLITKSWVSAPSLNVFGRNRFLRIMPALIVCVAMLGLVAGPVFSAAASFDYFSDPQLGCFLLNAVFISKCGVLPGVFDGGLVNAPLWTLAFEASCYALIAVLGVMRVLRPLACLGIGLTLVALTMAPGIAGAGTFLFKLALLGPPFFIGAAIARFAHRVPLDARLAALSAAMLGLSLFNGMLTTAFAFFGVYLVLWIAFAPLGRSVRRVGAAGDFSYGLYLWGWPVQMAAAAIIGGPPAMNFLISLPAALVLALASWRYVEQPAIALKARLRADRAPGAPLNFRKWGKGEPKALPPRADAAIRIQNHD